MNLIACICCRGGSKGVQGKALREINGKTLVEHAVECAKGSGLFNLLVVASDDNEILKAAIGARRGISMFTMGLPERLVQDNSSKWETFNYIFRSDMYAEDEILVDLDIGTPMRTPEDIRECVNHLMVNNNDLVCTAYEADRNPYFNMVEVVNGKVQLVKQLSEPITNRQQAPKVYALSPAVYAIKREALFKYDHWSQANLGIHVIPRERAWDIDTELDFKIVKFLMEGKP